jgi:hypothetical protein
LDIKTVAENISKKRSGKNHMDRVIHASVRKSRHRDRSDRLELILDRKVDLTESVHGLDTLQLCPLTIQHCHVGTSYALLLWHLEHCLIASDFRQNLLPDFKDEALLLYALAAQCCQLEFNYERFEILGEF